MEQVGIEIDFKLFVEFTFVLFHAALKTTLIKQFDLFLLLFE